jgi:hypothetical protein
VRALKRYWACKPPAPWHIGIAPNGRNNAFARPDDKARLRSLAIAPRVRLWKVELQSSPTNRNDHRRQSLSARHIEMEQDRTPPVLPDHAELAGSTPDEPAGGRRVDRGDQTKTGLKVRCELDNNLYEKGINVNDAERATLNIEGEAFHPE